MLINIKKASDALESEVTPQSVYKERRKFMGGLASVAFASAAPAAMSLESLDKPVSVQPPWLYKTVLGAAETAYGKDETPAPYGVATGYNNFYEFGYDKGDPAKRADSLKTDPWSVDIGGLCENSGVFTLEDVLKGMPLEERIYRLRCVEAWSMVIPWIGFPLAELIKRAKPLSSAKYVEFQTLYDPEQMPGQRNRFSTIRWPYQEGLRMDEAMNPLTLMAVGLYGEVLPKQNGAPIRLVVPWKYGFKSIKSVVAIRFVDEMPATSWSQTAPSEYGFYANVNPEVDHPRWSQATERRLPSGLFSANRIDTQMFNGYGEEVAHMYSGLDLKKNY